MMKLWTPLTLPLATLALLAGCSIQPSTTPNSQSGATINPTPENAVSTANSGSKVQAFMMRGMVTWGHESYSIQPCNSQKQYWVVFPPSDHNKIREIAPYNYEPMYAEVIGVLEPAPDDGFAADYDGRFMVKQTNLLSAEMLGGCQMGAHYTNAFGMEPSWDVKIQKDAVIFSQMGMNNQQQAITQRQSTSGKQVYQGKDFRLTLTKGHCSDTMSDSLYGWQSNLTWQGKTFKGCATIGATDVTANWVGQYKSAADATNTPGLTTSLTLLPDHSAITRYEYDSNEPALEEQGLWQQVSEDSVKVMMTSHQGRRLLSERIYTIEETAKGKRLIAHDEIINGHEYSLGEGGLQLQRQP
ncbi:COG3650 family protein [Photobacterium kagoshimensis]|uniref:COG3650 family protein n=1 Tax=Photobacterium kagoshimensis TaxID=2910242 RepID=UPI003D0B8ED2